MVRRLLPLVALLALLLPPNTAAAWTRPGDRIAGTTRYDTAALISEQVFAEGAATAVIASGESFPDGLAAGPLAGLLDAPVLLTPRDELNIATANELERLSPTRVLVVGGTAAISDDVLEEIEEQLDVEPSRIAGETRYATATAVASLFPSPAPVAFVASGVDFPDALAGGAAASMGGAPLLLTPHGELPDAVGDELARLAPPEALVLGGSGAVSDAVVAAVDARVAGVRRLAGTDRYGTAAAIAADRAGGTTQVLMATGESFPDALAAAPLARHRGAPILLTTTCAPSATITFQRDRAWPDVTVIGGTGAVQELGLSLPCSPVPDGVIAPGVTLTTQVLGGPNVVRLLTIDRTQGAVVRPVTASGHIIGRLTTTEIARGNGVPVAVNGTFFTESGEPSYALALDGRLAKAPGAGGTIMGLDRTAPTEYFFAAPEFDITLGDLEIDKVNSGAAGATEIALQTGDDARVIEVGTDYCRAELEVAGTPTVDAEEGGTVQPYVIDDVDCDGSDVAATTDRHVVFALDGTPEGDLVEELPVGEAVELRWSTHPAATGFTDVIGGNLRLVIGNQVATDVTMNSGPFFSERAPRTAIGALPDGRLVIVVNDGRQPGHSVGFTPRELADFMVGLGCIDALNLDGGGSTSLAVDGMLGNRPSGGAQRAVGSAILID